MKLQLLDVDDYISTRRLKPVTATTGRNLMDVNGVFSEEIFGRLGSRQRKRQFSYINLNCNIVHPEALSILMSLNTDLNKLLLGKDTYIITEQGELAQSETGQNGVLFFIQNYENIDFKKIAKPEKGDHVEFIERNKDNILIDKYLVLPAGIRDIQTSQKSGKTMMQFSDITAMYERLLRQCNSIIGDVNLLPLEVVGPMVDRIQRTLKEINNWIKERMKGKHGLIRGGVLKKAVDYCARLIIAPDPKLKLGYVGIPWQIILKLHEPFTVYEITNHPKSDLIKDYLNLKNNLDITEIRRFIGNVNSDPYSIPGPIKQFLIEIAEKVVDDRVVVYKRDPTENRDTWIASHVRVDDTAFIMKLNPYDLCKNGGDFDGDTVGVYALLTEESQYQAKHEMCPRYTVTAAQPGGSAGKLAYYIDLDASAAIYSATKE